MQKFAIFEKSNKFYWSTNRIYYSMLCICLAVLYVKKNIFHFEENIIDKIFVALTVGTFVLGIFSLLVGLMQVKPLRGELNGYLVFNIDYIQVKEEVFKLEDITKIQISNEDYLGKREYSRGNFGPALSNGTNNFLVIFLKTGQSKRFQYELCNSDDFQKIRPLLIQYYVRGKIDFSEVSTILGEYSSEEVRDFKIEIERVREELNVKSSNPI